jgi:hypothetical protein
MAFAYFPLNENQVQIRKRAWEGLMGKHPFGRAAIMNCPKPDLEQLSQNFTPADDIPLAGPAGSMPEWDDMIRRQICDLHLGAMSRYEDDSYPAINIPRIVHRGGQGFAEIFGCEIIGQGNDPNLFYPVPWIRNPSDLAKMKLRPPEDSWIGRAIEFAAYARAVTANSLAIRNPVMAGPIDNALLVLGTMQLMHWIYDEPAALHEFLEIITDVLIDVVHRLQNATGGALCPDHCWCLPHGFALCSEVRSLLSVSMFEEFEAPCLRRIGRECGPYMIHSCGTWERTLPIDMQDENLVLVNFQTKEMNLEKVYAYTQGRLSLYVGESINLGDRYLWPCETDFYRYLMTAFPEEVPLSFSIKDMYGYLQAQEETGGGTAGMFRWRIG